jgi:hypothetical protein
MSHFSITKYASLTLFTSLGGKIVISLFKQGWSTLLRIYTSLKSLVPRYSSANILSKRFTAKLWFRGTYVHSMTFPYAPFPISRSRYQSYGISKSSSSFLKLIIFIFFVNVCLTSSLGDDLSESSSDKSSF